MFSGPEIAGVILYSGAALVYGLALLGLTLYGLNFLYLLILSWRHRDDRFEVPSLRESPLVTVQIPIYNERFVVERAIEAACHLDWPRERLEIQVLDDSTDATFEIVAQAVARWRAAGVDIVHLHRTTRTGYKAGALSEGLAVAKGDYTAIFDADFVPPPNFLQCTVPHFLADERIGWVQARWGHLNQNSSLLTACQSTIIDSHFVVEQFARERSGYVMHFNGAGGIWRRSTIEDAGGWDPLALNEDLDLSYRAALRGWKPRLLRDLVVPGELVGQMSSYRQQQSRWAHGSVQCARRMLPRVWRSPFPLRVKIQSLFHLTGNFIQLLMLIMWLVYPLLLSAADRFPLFQSLYTAGWIFTPITLVPILYYVYGQLIIHRHRRIAWRRVAYLVVSAFMTSGLMVGTTSGIIRGLRGQVGVFTRTPKSGQVGRRSAAPAKGYIPPLDRIVLGEMALCLFSFNTFALAWRTQNFGIILYSSTYLSALTYVVGLSLWQYRWALRAYVRRLWLNWTSAETKTHGASFDAARVVLDTPGENRTHAPGSGGRRSIH